MSIDLETAQKIVRAAHTEAAQRSVLVSAAVVDAGGLFGLHANGNGRFVIFGGGVPIIVNDTVIGGVGVSGAAVSDDCACADAAAAAFGT